MYLFPVRGAPDLRTHAHSSRARSEFHKSQPFTVELPTPHPCCLLPQPLAPFLPPGPDSRIPHSSLILIQPPFDPRPNCNGGSIRQKARYGPLRLNKNVFKTKFHPISKIAKSGPQDLLSPLLIDPNYPTPGGGGLHTFICPNLPSALDTASRKRSPHSLLTLTSLPPLGPYVSYFTGDLFTPPLTPLYGAYFHALLRP